MCSLYLSVKSKVKLQKALLLLEAKNYDNTSRNMGTEVVERGELLRTIHPLILMTSGGWVGERE